MDFTALLNLASKNKVVNEKTAASAIGYSTELGPPKRVAVTKPKGVLSASVKAFLDKKEQEEKEKEREAQKKKVALLAIRKESKSTKKANAMAKRTKDNLKSWSDEQLVAMRDQEKIDLQKLEEKRLAFIKKLGESEKRSGSKNVVKMAPESLSAHQRAKDKALMAKYDQDDDSDDDTGDVKCDVISPEKKLWDNEAYRRKDIERHKEIINRKSSHKSTDSKDKQKSGNKSKNKSSSDKHKEKHKDKHKDKHHHNDHKLGDKKNLNGVQAKVVKKPKIVRRAHQKPVLSFQDLINMANEKHKEVQEPESVPKKKVDAKKPKESRPMTQEEKDRIARRSTKEYKEWYTKGGVRPGLVSPDSSGKPTADRTGQQHRGPSEDKPPPLIRTPGAKTSSHPSNSNEGRERSKSAPGSSTEQMAKLVPKSNNSSIKNGKVPPKVPSSSGPPVWHSTGATPKGGTANSRPQMGLGKGQGTPQAAKREAPGPLKKPEPALNPFDRIYNEIKKKNPKPEKRRRVIESEDEEEMDDFIADSEDDDFIDDSGPVDVSSAIRDIFGYDKRRFRNERLDDIDNMEASFGQTLKEEARSAKIGRLEDLEDMRLEEEENKRKMMLKKKQKMMKRH